MPAAVGTLTDRVWTLQELSILHELHNPVAVVVYGLFDSSQSSSSLQESAHVIFQNTSSVQQFGVPRSSADHSNALHSLSNEERQFRRNWIFQIAQGKAVQQPRVDIYKLFGPLFSGKADDVLGCKARIESKPIKVQTLPGKAESAIMHVVDMEASNADKHISKRFAAMVQHTPLHTFLFNKHGKLLVANDAAMEACLHSTAGLKVSPGQDVTLKALFDMGSYPGGEEEAHTAYEDAVQAIFHLQLERYCHTQAHHNPEKGGAMRWECIEMWPMQDPVDLSPAVLVKRYNVTHQKELELQLSGQQEALQKQNQALEQDSADLHQDRVRLELEAQALAQRLDAVMHDKFGPQSSGFDADTPIDKTLNFLHAFIAGERPLVQTAMDLYHILSESDTHLRNPVALETQLLADEGMDDEVGESMLQLLQGSNRVTRELARGVSVSKTAGVITSLSHQSSLSAFIPANITPAIERWLKDAESNWQFDIFGFAEACSGASLSMLGFHLYRQAGMIRDFKLDEQKLCNWLHRIESGYNVNNPYHNSTHATSVLQMTHMLLCHGGILKSKVLSRAQYMSSYWSAITHDYEHGGLNNDFLIKTANPLAILYNDQSPLENHHCAAAARLLFDPSCQYIQFAALTSEAIKQVRDCCINQVLGTDMKKHFDITSRFQAAFRRPPANSLGSTNRCESLQVDWDKIKPEDKTLAHQMVVKCADIGHLAADPKTHKRWALLLEEEFFRQGDKEKGAGLAVSPLMDRTMQGGMTRSQLGFFNIVGVPLFKTMVELFEEAQPMLDGVLTNFRHWEAGTTDV
ncbi:TPA: hypothetical protein ACH3X1_007904 [Trebouxia sp. C0004]